MRVLYTATATATGDGRNGRITSSDGLLDAAVRSPVELGGEGGATNPEQLFAAGYAACFHSALRRVARSAGADVTGSSVTARVGIGPVRPGAFGLCVALDVTLPEVAKTDAEKLVAEAHQVCPYSNATRGNIEVTLSVLDTAGSPA
jgi:osmotically inducible protein OsmC